MVGYAINAQLLFKDEAQNVGLQDHLGYADLGNGLSLADFDNDGWDDITLPSANGIPLRFYKNYQGYFFQEMLIDPAITYQTRSVNWVDFDNDGDKDLFITSDTNGNRLFENTDNGLIDITLNAGFSISNLLTFGASWGDINNDGCLDVYLSNRVEVGTITNLIYMNNCDGTFSDVTNDIGLENDPAPSFCAGFFDFNNDGWQDIYVANDKYAPNYLYKNNGDGTFTDVSVSSGTDIIADAMSVTIHDYNSDGFFDIYVTDTPAEFSTPGNGSVLLRNNGDETFTDVSSLTGTQLNSFSWGANFFDAENDGDLDLYVSCSFDGSFENYASSGFFINNGNSSYSMSNSSGFDTDFKRSYANGISDLNHDGKVDIVVMNNDNEIPFLWNNQTNTNNNYLKINLLGTISNKDGVGSMIEISVDGQKQYRYTLCGEGYLTQNSNINHFGIGANSIIDYVKVKWLSGIEDIQYNVVANQLLNIVEGSTLSIEDVNNTLQTKVFPNPFFDELYVESIKQINSGQIYSITGLKLMTFINFETKTKLNLKGLPSGIYFLKLDLPNTSQIIKVIKK